jgi:hypothetical protein
MGEVCRARYDVAPDGERFVTNWSAKGAPTEIWVVTTWFQELERLGSTGTSALSFRGRVESATIAFSRIGDPSIEPTSREWASRLR